jgi:hypothetical protein
MVIYGENIRFWPTLEMGEEEVKKWRSEEDRAADFEQRLRRIESVHNWPEPYIYAVYNRIFDEILAKTTVPGIYTPYVPYRLGFSPQPPKNILVSHSCINPAPWNYLIYTNSAQGFLPDRLQNTPKIPVFQSRTPKIKRYFSCAQSSRRAKNDIFARWYKVCTVYGSGQP